jgi:hypothetical protein
MFAPTSRYANVTTLQAIGPDGEPVAYKARRILRAGRSIPVAREITVTQGDRLDLITARTLGDPEQFWRVCDANDAMDPLDLTAELGRTLRIPVPQF